MNRDVIKALIDALAASDLAELEYSSNGETLRLVKRATAASAARPAQVQAPAQVPAPGAEAPPAPEPDQPSPAPRGAAPDTVVAPLYGVVHLEPSPGAPPLVSVGQSIAAGQVLCTIEAMKVFTQIRAECCATVAAVLVRSGEEVEAGQPLFRLG